MTEETEDANDSELVGEISIVITKEGWHTQTSLPAQDAVFWLEATKQRILNDVIAVAAE